MLTDASNLLLSPPEHIPGLTVLVEGIVNHLSNVFPVFKLASNAVGACVPARAFTIPDLFSVKFTFIHVSLSNE